MMSLGNTLNSIITKTILQLVLKNPREIQPYQVHSLKLKRGIEHAIDNDISILALTKTDLDWNQTTYKEQ